MAERTLHKPYTKYRLHIHKITRMHILICKIIRNIRLCISLASIKIITPNWVIQEACYFFTRLESQLLKLSMTIFFCLALISTLKILISNKIKAIFHIHMHIDMQNKVSTAHAVYGADLTTNLNEILLRQKH